MEPRNTRKTQKNGFMKKLLDGVEVEWKILGDVALGFGRGKSKHRPRNDSKLYGGDIPFIQTGDIRNASHIIQKFSQTYSEFELRQKQYEYYRNLLLNFPKNTGILK
jgi:type I restriction enzyme S subunit